MGIEKDYGDRPVTDKGQLEAINRVIIPIGRLTRGRVNAALAPAFVTSSDAGTLYLDWAAHRHYQVTLTEDITEVVFTNSADYGADFFVRFIQGDGEYTVTGWPDTVHWVGGVRPTVTATADRSDIFKLFYDGSEYWTEVSQNFE